MFPRIKVIIAMLLYTFPTSSNLRPILGFESQMPIPSGKKGFEGTWSAMENVCAGVLALIRPFRQAVMPQLEMSSEPPETQSHHKEPIQLSSDSAGEER